MSQHRQDYGPPDGYYSRPNSNHALPHLAHTNGFSTTHLYSPSDSNHPPAGYSPNAIPGLGLSPPNVGATWLPPPPHLAQPPGLGQPLSTSLDRSGRAVTASSFAAPHGDQISTYDVDNLEEGELSEGELEDIYEPQESGLQDFTSDRGRLSGVSGATTRAQNTTGFDGSGSYSPHLSPVNVRPENPSQRQFQRESYRDESAMDQRPKGGSTSTDHAHRKDSVTHRSTEMSVNEARKQAQDAILRLWPLNVRFQDYVKEGIDERLLQTLFRDLGLDANDASASKLPSQAVLISQVVPASQAVSASRAAPASQAVPAVSTSQAVSASQVAASSLPEPAASTPKESTEQDSKDMQAESRKDRIARLLAAKGSKQITTPKSNTPTRAQTPQRDSTPAKPQNEKSRLLQQKMEALQRAREAKAQQPAQLSELTTGRSDTPQLESNNHAVNSPQPVEVQESLEQPNDRASSAIPGLFLSSTPQPGESPRPRKRPVASDLNTSSDTPVKRPFGQPRQSQPFLIDVSDDDDDAAMEIDSPEMHPAAINRPSSPFKIPLLADPTGTPIQISNRHVSSPAAVLTSGCATPASKKNDLASMDKEIEAMKRKIAEAEARKRVKQSLPSSPGTPLSAEQAGKGTTNSYVATAKPTTSTEGSGMDRDDSSPPVLSRSEREEVTETVEVAFPRRPRLSRAASERLPLIEALRKQQLLKLQMLQSQIRKVEDEIQKSMEEEKALMEENGSTSGHNSSPEDLSAAQISTDNVPPQRTDAIVSKSALPVPSAVQSENDRQQDTAMQQDLPAADEESTNDASGETSDSRETEDPIPNASYGYLAGKVTHDAATEDAMSLDDESGHQPGNDSDTYEPPEAEIDSSDASFSPVPTTEQTLAEAVDAGAHVVSSITPITQPISLGKQRSRSESPREVVSAKDSPPDAASRSGFVPYETPLQYFRAYRFHPLFNESIAGGLRSLTYSNKIDVQKEFCPDQLAGVNCTKGTQCEFQHFESTQAPDDQIIMQLGAYNDYEGERKQDYVNGLRQLLSDFRTRKVKDFQAITQGIIDYRTQFRGDKTKILPLGDVRL